MSSVHRIASIAAVSFAALLGGGGALAQGQPDKAVNSQKFAKCVTDDLQESYRQAFQRASEGPVRAGDEAAMVDRIIVAQETVSISMSCISKVSGVPQKDMPPVKDEKRWATFYLSHFEEDAFSKVLQAVGKIMPAVEAEGIAILKRKSDLRPR